MEPVPVYFTEEKWERLEREIHAIKELLAQLVVKYEKALEEETEILTAKQAAQLLGIDLPTMYAKCANKMIPHFRAGKQYRFNRHEILEWKENSNRSKEIDVDQYVNRYLQQKVLKG